MTLGTKRWWIVGGVIVVVLLLGLWYYRHTHPPVPAFPVNSADTISSWTFKGDYAGNDTLTTQATADRTKLEGLLGKGQYDDYDIYDGIGNDDTWLGEGAAAYDAYNRAIALYPTKGLAYANLGHLMDEMGAYHTASDAYAKAVAVEPGMLAYHLMRLKFLTTRLPGDTTALQAAFADASTQFGDVAEVLTIEAQWLTDQKRYADAIAAWERVKLISPGRDMTSIDAEIARLKAKE